MKYVQESEKGHWHIPILSEHDYEAERPWSCITRAKSQITRQNSKTGDEGEFPVQSVYDFLFKYLGGKHERSYMFTTN